MKTLAFRGRSGGETGYLVLLHTSEAPDPEEWRAYVREFESILSDRRRPVHAFVATDGGSPDAAQRKELAEVVMTGDALTHVFTTDAVIRGVVTAFRWIARSRAVAHLPREFPEVCAACGLVASEVMSDFNELRRSLPRVEMVARIAASMQPPAQKARS
jgi:hypothetical protein